MPTVVTIADESGSYIPISAWGPFPYGGSLFAVSLDQITMQVVIFRSNDDGATWSVEDDSGPDVYSYVVALTGKLRQFEPAVVIDGSTIHVFYFTASAIPQGSFLAHKSYDLAGGGWSSATTSTVAAVIGGGGSDYPLASVSQFVFVCTWPQGGWLIGYHQSNITAGWQVRAGVVVFDGSTWGTDQTVNGGTYNLSDMGGLAPNELTGGAHVFILSGGGLRYVPMDSSEVLGTGISVDSATFCQSVLAWNYGGNYYVAALYHQSTLEIVAVSPASAISFTKKTAYTRAVGESALGYGGILQHRAGSLHCIFWWLNSGAPASMRLYKNCFAFLEGGSWGTAEMILEVLDPTGVEPPTDFRGYLSGSTLRSVYAPGSYDSGEGTTGETYLRYLTEALANCASCCCANFAY